MGGNYNTGVGYHSLIANTTGGSNTAVGDEALTSNTSGSDNTTVGEDALNDNTTGLNNTAIGEDALTDNQSGDNNAAVGEDALYYNVTGHGNAAVGHYALRDSTDNNTAVGSYAFYDLASGTHNVALGHTAGGNLTSGSHNVYISNDGLVGESNTMRIGDVNQPRAFVAGIDGVTVSGGTLVYIKPDGQLGTTTSSACFKTGIADLGSASDMLYALRPVTFQYNPEIDPDGLTQYGLIAEEVAEVASDLVITDENGEPYTVRYEQLVPLLLNEIQKQHGVIDAQQDQIGELWAEIEALKEAVDSLRD